MSDTKTKTPHTPGPWEVAEYYPVGGGLLVTPAGSHWPLATVRRVGQPDRIDSANAQLIAAAPDLLAACEAGRQEK